jgi:hypothetical protein
LRGADARLQEYNKERQMTVTIELSPELEASLGAIAAARGVELPEYVQRVLEEQVPVHTENLSPAERAAAWPASTKGLALRPPLSDAAIFWRSASSRRSEVF